MAVTSCDPIYHWEAVHIRERIVATYDKIIDQTRRNSDQFVWSSIRSVDELGQVRMAAMEAFLSDYRQGRADGRYVEAELPKLPFADRSFDLALCSHLLFLYSVQLGEDFHRDSLRELCRVAREVRVFPLLALRDRSLRELSNAARTAVTDSPRLIWGICWAWRGSS